MTLPKLSRPATSGGLNPFALTRVTSEGALGAKLAMLSRLVGAMAGGLSRDERPALDRALRAAYDARGIGPDPATHGRRPPTLETLVERLADTPGGAPLSRRLERWATGSLARLFTADYLYSNFGYDDKLSITYRGSLGTFRRSPPPIVLWKSARSSCGEACGKC